MDPLEPPALHHVKAAFGWIELGNVPEALAELREFALVVKNLKVASPVPWIIGNVPVSSPFHARKG